MRIQKITLRNLNSLVGTWHIDLTHNAYIADGIFSITGPTGSGKSTILDAICLALYGRTPRLAKITKSANEIMSRKTGDCMAEVTFSTQAGVYRCHWAQHRAHKKAYKELQNPKHEISDEKTGKIIESSLRAVATIVEQVTGMDFDRFTRSMLLAQGGFSAFLQAAANERAPILEQITGTEIYSQISIRVHERRSDERNRLNILQAETVGILILDPEQEAEIQSSLSSKQVEESDLAVKSAAAEKAIAWLTTIDSLKKEISGLKGEASDLQSDIADFKDDRDKLAKAKKAGSLDGLFATLTAIRKEQGEDQTAKYKEEESVPVLERLATEQANLLKLAEQQTLRAKEELKTAAPLLQRVRSLDQSLLDRKTAVTEAAEICQKDALIIGTNKKTRLRELQNLTDWQTKQRLVDDYLKNNGRDEWLIGELAGVEQQLGSLFSVQNEIVQVEADQNVAAKALELASQSLQNCQKLCDDRKQDLNQSRQQIQQGKHALSQLLGDRQLREYRKDLETLLREMAFLARITELEEQRNKLEDGQPCPLCGANDHPYAVGNVPVPNENERMIEAVTQLINNAETQESAIDKLEKAEVKAREHLIEADKLVAAAANRKEAAEKTITELQGRLNKSRSTFSELKQVVSFKLKPLGITEIPESISSLLESMRKRLATWQSQVKKKADIDQQIAGFESEIKRLDAVINTQDKALAEKKERLEALREAYADGKEERIALYGDAIADVEERRLNQAVASAENAEKKARNIYNEQQHLCGSAQARVETLTKRIEQRESNLKQSEIEFSKGLKSVGFTDEACFLEAKLTIEQTNELSDRAKVLDDRQLELEARRKDRESRLALEAALKVTDKSLLELEPIFNAYKDTLQELQNTISGLKHKLLENTAAKARIEEKHAHIESQKEECRRWENLHELIGSADGKKYRNFAQGLTFELMIGHANRQLQDMTERYVLIQDDSQPLELNVIDNYQAGEVRSTKNLSGGESFIVSLALALGLSQMASKNVRVDSLFLDEGFGMLDEESLETALETLANLQQNGKLIGIISHVPALKDRISTQIKVTPKAGGVSLISGPGCGRLTEIVSSN